MQSALSEHLFWRRIDWMKYGPGTSRRVYLYQQARYNRPTRLNHLPSPTGSVSHKFWLGKNMTQGDIPDCPFLFDRHSQRHAEFSICHRDVDRQPLVTKKPDDFQLRTGSWKGGHRWDRIESTVCGDKLSGWRRKNLARCLGGKLNLE